MMVATLEPGLAWIEMATVDGGISRRQLGNPPPPALAAAAGGGGGATTPLALLPRFPPGGAICLLGLPRFVPDSNWAH